MNHFINGLKKYTVFEGRSTRSEYWYFILVQNLIIFFIVFLSFIFSKYSQIMLYVRNIIGLALLLPSLAVGVRRLHDVGKSGWMVFINIVPLVGWIWTIVLLATDSNPGDNKYGPNPKLINSPVQATPSQTPPQVNS